jgi:hypothetical protein
MGSRSFRRFDRLVRGVAPWAALASLAISGFMAQVALAQHPPDAGAPSSAGPAGARRIGAPHLKSIPNASSVLSEGVRARLAERAAARHPSEIAAHEAAPEPKPAPAAAAAPVAREHAPSEPLRRGIAHQRRVQALDTGNGITVLSNRVSEPPPIRNAGVRPYAAVEAELAAGEREALADESSVTETRSLRALSSRREVPKARERSLGVDWLLWPFVLLLATGAVVGTLWFSKKTQ